MLEIYNERCRDLLKTGKESLKIRQHPKKGFYGKITYEFHQFFNNFLGQFSTKRFQNVS